MRILNLLALVSVLSSGCAVIDTARLAGEEVAITTAAIAIHEIAQFPNHVTVEYPQIGYSPEGQTFIIKNASPLWVKPIAYKDQLVSGGRQVMISPWGMVSITKRWIPFSTEVPFLFAACLDKEGMRCEGYYQTKYRYDPNTSRVDSIELHAQDFQDEQGRGLGGGENCPAPEGVTFAAPQAESAEFVFGGSQFVQGINNSVYHVQINVDGYPARIVYPHQLFSERAEVFIRFANGRRDFLLNFVCLDCASNRLRFREERIGVPDDGAWSTQIMLRNSDFFE